jgi:predicted amidophosphoribosyltransferase
MPETYYCSTCKAEIPVSAKVCRTCGTSSATDSTWKPSTADEVRMRRNAHASKVFVVALLFGLFLGALALLVKLASNLTSH